MITKTGYENLLSKIEDLNSQLKNIIKMVAEGIEDRDFREDSNFSVAVAERTKIQKKINELDEVANNCRIPEIDKSTVTINFGKSAKLMNVDSGEIREFTVVGPYETDPKKGKISYLSPMGKAMLGIKKGEDFEVITPSREQYWEVLEIFIN